MPLPSLSLVLSPLQFLQLLHDLRGCFHLFLLRSLSLLLLSHQSSGIAALRHALYLLRVLLLLLIHFLVLLLPMLNAEFLLLLLQPPLMLLFTRDLLLLLLLPLASFCLCR